MLLYLGTIVLAAVVVALTKGSFRRLGRIDLHAIWLLLLAIAIQVGLEFVTLSRARMDDVGFGLLMLSYALILAFCVVNRRTSGLTIVAIGVVLNLLVIGLNHGMPTADQVKTRSGVEVSVPIERSVKHRPERSDDKLQFLSDQIVFPGFPDEVYSIGDIVIIFGILVICFEASRRPRRFGRYLDQAATASS